MIYKRQPGTIQRRRQSYNLNTQVPCRDSSEWRNYKQIFNNSYHQELQKQTINDKINQNYCSNMQNTENIELKEINIFPFYQVNDKNITSKLQKIEFQDKDNRMNKEFKQQDISNYINKDQIYQQTFLKDSASIINVENSHQQIEQTESYKRRNEYEINKHQKNQYDLLKDLHKVLDIKQDNNINIQQINNLKNNQSSYLNNNPNNLISTFPKRRLSLNLHQKCNLEQTQIIEQKNQYQKIIADNKNGIQNFKELNQNQQLQQSEQQMININDNIIKNHTENNINSFKNIHLNTLSNSLVNYNGVTEEQFDLNEEASILPTTYRQVLNDNGIKYNTDEYERLIKLIPNESELSKLKYYFLPLKIQQQEDIIEKSNQNVMKLQESIQMLLQREAQCKQEYQDYQNLVEKDISSLFENQKQLSKEIMDKENIIQSIQIQLDMKSDENQQLLKKKNRQEFSKFEQTKSEIEYCKKEKEMKIQIILKENEDIKKENKTLREEKILFLEQINDLERNIQAKDNKTTKLILDRKNQNEDFSMRQNTLIQENQQLREEINITNIQNRKLLKNLQDQQQEHRNLKQIIFDLASSVSSFKNIKIDIFKEDSFDDQIPTNILYQYIELLKNYLQNSQKQTYQNQNINQDQLINKNNYNGSSQFILENRYQQNNSTLVRQELD